MRKIIFIFFISFLWVSNTEAFTGTIDSVSHTAKVCRDVTCASPTPGSINFAPTSGTAVVIDSVTGLSGQIWGNELGWIDLNPTGEGVTFADPILGVLTGKAWSQVSGWINFAPTGQQVIIDRDNGQFSGWAWSGGPYGGWVKFDCASPSSCVKTSWRGGSSGNGGSGSSPRDVCPNIGGVQASIPNGYTVSLDGLCIQVIDVCPNIIGEQSAIPAGFIKNSLGACIPNIDYCPNITGVQAVVPTSHILTTNGNCIIPKKDMCKDLPGIQESKAECTATDLCTNLPGIQYVTPKGYSTVNNHCFLEVLDLCKNIEGNQNTIPSGQTINEKGECIALLVDICPNLGGQQSNVPLGFTLQKELCLFDTLSEEEEISLSGIPTIGFSFVPDRFMIPNDSSFLKNLARSLTHTEGEFKVDLVSVAISIIELIILIMLFAWIGKRLMR